MASGRVPNTTKIRFVMKASSDYKLRKKRLAILADALGDVSLTFAFLPGANHK